MNAPDPPEGPLDLYAQGRLALPLAAMRAVLESPDRDALARDLTRAEARWGEAALAPLRARLDASGERLRAVAGLLDHSDRAGAPDAVFARLAEGFNRAAAVAPDAGVAFYTLGDPDLLAQATGEVMAWLRSEGLLRPGLAVLEVGCGPGRFLRAFAEEATLALGVEISAGMAAEAARRLADRPNVAVVRGSGSDLGFLASGAFDLVLYADSFPYIVQAGGEAPLTMLRETARVLRPGGAVAVLNWSYRGDPALDARERGELAQAAGLRERPCAEPVFSGWDARASVLARRRA